jgi:phosphosulfolactate synthase
MEYNSPGVMQMDIPAELIQSPIPGRTVKPRSTGMTMVIDKGLSVTSIRSLFELSAPYIDLLKLGFGTIALYPPDLLEQKLALANAFHVTLYPGGTFMEIAHWQGRSEAVFEKLAALGFKWVEISDGTLKINPEERRRLIKTAIATGLQVITEAGKKDVSEQPETAAIAATVNEDLMTGASFVIIEARESGTGIGIYDPHGAIIPEKLAILRMSLPPDRIIWEAPQKNQQAELINIFGPNVNLGNLPATETMALEALRRGLRSDTWKKCLIGRRHEAEGESGF